MFGVMWNAQLRPQSPKLALLARLCALAAACICAAQIAGAQDTPLLSGGVGFFTSTNGGLTTYQPHIEPLIAAPLGNSLLFESRAILLESISQNGPGRTGYSDSHLASVLYMQGDYIASSHLTVVGGSFLLPFNTYNDRLSEIWIGDLQDGPLIAGLGTMGTGSGLGGMLSGNAFSNHKASLSYNGWFSARSGNFYFNSQRSAGLRASLYLPDSRLEIGFSYDRKLQNTHENFVGTHVWWEPKDTGLRLRSEYGHGEHAQGYWIQADYRTHAMGGPDNWIGRLEPVVRMQQSFRINSLGGDGVPGVNTTRTDFGLDYNLPHEVRILTSYSRQFAPNSNRNIWETGIVYRFLFPTWKGGGAH
jgi:hypothetical protein